MANDNSSHKRMHIYINENVNRIVRSECKKRGVTITDYVVSTALAFRADEASNKLDVTIRKLKNYMKRRGIKYSRRRCNDGKKKRKC